jgi:F-box interacting protein
VVRNPATERWVAVPATQWSNKVLDARLGFDPAISSHFHVFEFVHARVWDADTCKKRDNSCIKGVGIYSSKAGVWTHQNAWDQPIRIYNILDSAFFRGVMYLSFFYHLVVAIIDVEGKCRLIPIPTPHDNDASFDIYISRGQLNLVNYGASELSVWVLEDSASENWSLKHNVSHLQLLRKECSSSRRDYDIIIHPEHNEMFLIVRDEFDSSTTLMSYKLDSREPRFICNLEYGWYVPLLSDLLADGH